MKFCINFEKSILGSLELGEYELPLKTKFTAFANIIQKHLKIQNWSCGKKFVVIYHIIIGF